MFVLCACEESQACCLAFRDLGFEAFSCDILPCSGGHPEFHIQASVEPLLDGNCSFQTGDGKWHFLDGKWDLILAFPPCTHLCSSGARWWSEKRKDGRQADAVSFFMKFVYADCEHICIENPVGIMSTLYRAPDQIIQPWQFGHGEVKATCLWLKGLPLLQPSNIVSGREQRVWKMSPSVNRSVMRSKTYLGIASAFASQWGKFIYPLIDLEF